MSHFLSRTLFINVLLHDKYCVDLELSACTNIFLSITNTDIFYSDDYVVINLNVGY